MHLFTNITEPAEVSTGSTDIQMWPSPYPIFSQKLPKTVCLKDGSEGPTVKMSFVSIGATLSLIFYLSNPQRPRKIAIYY